MVTITEPEFSRICRGIREDRAIILQHNPIGTDEETLLWMLLGVLSSYLSLADNEMPCFTGTPNADTYYDAILFIMNGRGDFEIRKYLDELTT